MRDNGALRAAIPKGLIADIDRLRGLFAVLVLFGHAMDIAIFHAVPDLLRKPMAHLRPYSGFVWVVGFVVLSGYCIEASCRNMGRNFSLRRYLILRATRLLPALILATILAGAIEAAMLGSPYRPRVWSDGIDPAAFIWTLIGLGGFFGIFGSAAPMYTISYELLYYALWGASRRLAGSNAPRWAILANAAFALGVIGLLQKQIVGLPPIAAQIFTPFILLIYLPWLLGAFLVDEIDRLAANPHVARAAMFAWPLLAAVLIVGRKLFEQPQFAVTPASIIYYLLLSAAFGLILVRSRLRAPLRVPRPADAELGLLSYPLYLIHGPVIVLTGYAINASGVRLPFTIYLAILLVSALLAGLLLARCVEKPVLAMRQKWLAGTRRTRDQPPAGRPDLATTLASPGPDRPN